MDVALHGGVLVARFAGPQRMLSWALHRGGETTADAVAWVAVRNADLPRGVDPLPLLRTRLGAAGLETAVGLMTSANLATYVERRAQVADAEARCVATVGLSNAVRVGHAGGSGGRVGTINLLLWSAVPLDAGATLEAMSLAVEARTLAVYEANVPSIADGARATGTGTDCVVVASPLGASAATYAGKHTAIGQALGEAAYQAVWAGVARWLDSRSATSASVATAPAATSASARMSAQEAGATADPNSGHRAG